MPVYSFVCKACSIFEDGVFDITAEVIPPTCPTCHQVMRRSYEFGSVAFKGTGFYRTDK
jgi:putative FmdB family regulatory protein